MKKLILFCLLFAGAITVKAQRVYFIYFQTEASEPFFLRMNDKLYSSTSSGYLILSKIKDSSYNFKIGFPGKDVDMSFSVTMNRKDHGFLIKNFGEKGWGLFDLQTLGIQMSSTNIKGAAMMNSDTEIDAFTELLSKASNDPSIKQTPIFAKAEEKKPDVIQPAVVKENVITNTPQVKTEEKKAEEKKTDIAQTNSPKENKPDSNQGSTAKAEEKKIEETLPPSIKTEEKKTVTTDSPAVVMENKTENTVLTDPPAYKKSQVVKISGNRTSNGIEINFVDQYPDGKKDTVNIVIPVEDKNDVPKERELAKEDKKFLDITENTKAVDSVKTKPVVVPPKSKCKVIAIEDDFLKLRRKMSVISNDDGKINEAKKYFKTKCFTTVHIRNLSSMFLSDAGKYHFFDAAYEYVSDAQYYSSLVSTMNDEYYISRFKAMLHN